MYGQIPTAAVAAESYDGKEVTMRMISRASRPAKTLFGAIAMLLVIAPAAFAATSSFGPQNWSSGTETGRYRSQIGTHNIKPFNGCGSSYLTIELRVDKIDADDPSEGTRTIQCGTTGGIYGSINSYQSAYRGHFMKSHSSWYGTLQDTHP